MGDMIPRFPRRSTVIKGTLIPLFFTFDTPKRKVYISQHIGSNDMAANGKNRCPSFKRLPAGNAWRRTDDMPVITIRGTWGSNAPEIGELIAQKLGIDYVDQKIIANVARQLRTSDQAIIEKEMPPSTLLGRIAEAIRSNYAFDSGYLDMYTTLVDFPLDDKNYLAGLQHVIEEMAKCQAIVIRGRGGQFILKDFPGAFHVMIVAPLEQRLNRVMADMKLDEKKAREEIKKFDDSLREFMKRYFRAEANDPVHYDLVINTGHFSIEAAAALVIDALPLKQ
jgi:hypothetical protein